MDEIALRKEAIRLYLEGTSHSQIASTLHKSRPWVYKWISRYEAHPNGEWFEDHSRTPKRIHKKIDPAKELLILEIRKKLDNTHYAQIGAISIQWELNRLGIEAPPIWTIDRILSRNKVIRNKAASVTRLNEYPKEYFVNIHQMDLVGPRYIKDYGRFYSLNIIAPATHCVQINPIPGKAAEFIVPAVMRFWQNFGVPDFLQMDNELSFRGSNRHPRSFGKLIRFALSRQVSPVFIPQGEPWRNGIIEHFNDTFDKKFFRSERFTGLEHVKSKAYEFEQFHNQHYRYKANNSRTPLNMFERQKPKVFLDQHYKLPDSLPLSEGKIYLIRFIRSECQLTLFNEKFKMPKELAYSYVIAIISIEKQKLKIIRDNQIIEEIDYQLPVDEL